MKQIQPIANACEKETVEVLSGGFSRRSQERISTGSNLSRCYQTDQGGRVMLSEILSGQGQCNQRCIRMKRHCSLEKVQNYTCRFSVLY